MHRRLQVRLGSLSLRALASTRLMTSMLDQDGTILHLSSAYVSRIADDGRSVEELIGSNLAQVLGGPQGVERVQLAKHAIDLGRALAVRCVLKGVQHISHFHPVSDPSIHPVPFVVKVHYVVEGEVQLQDFEPGEYIESVYNNYGPLASLSAREVQIASLLSQGFDTRQIAERTFRTQHTINSHKKSIFNKLNCSTSAQAVLIIRRAGLTERDAPRIGAASQQA
jgi:DNA-binding CsgD family transcriptional regulator